MKIRWTKGMKMVTMILCFVGFIFAVRYLYLEEQADFHLVTPS